MKRLTTISLCLIVFILCTAESCKEKKANKVVEKLLSTWNIEALNVENISKLSSGATDGNTIKSLRIDFDKYLAQHGDLFWFATYGDDSQEQFEGRYEVSSDSKTLAITLYLENNPIKIIENPATKTYLFFESETDDITDKDFTIKGEYEPGKTIVLVGKKF